MSLTSFGNRVLDDVAEIVEGVSVAERRQVDDHGQEHRERDRPEGCQSVQRSRASAFR